MNSNKIKSLLNAKYLIHFMEIYVDCNFYYSYKLLKLSKYRFKFYEKKDIPGFDSLNQLAPHNTGV